MGLFLRKKEESGKLQLAANPQKRGLSGKGRGASDGKLDNAEDHQVGSSSDSPRDKVEPTTPATPPVTPDQVHEQLPVSDVSLVRKSTITKDGVIQNLPTQSDDPSEYSDLTDNRTLQRHNEQKEAYEKSRSLDQKTGQENNKTIMEPVVPWSPDKSEGFFAELWGYVENACKVPDLLLPEPDAAEEHELPEWGIPPAFSDHDSQAGGNQKPRPNHGESQLEVLNTGGQKDSGEGNIANKQKSQRRSKNRSTAGSKNRKASNLHENFEVILEVRREEQPQPQQVEDYLKKRPWITNPFRRVTRKGEEEEEEQGKEAEVHEIPSPSSFKSEKAHQDMVKQALFPDYDEKKSSDENDTDPIRRQLSYSTPEKNEEIPVAVSNSQKPARVGLFASLRRRGKPTVESSQEDKALSSSQARSQQNAGKSQSVESLGKNVVEDIYRDLEEMNYTGTPPGSFPEASKNENKFGPGKSVGNTRSSEVADGPSPPEEAANPAKVETDHLPGFVGGFMALISETVAAMHAGKSIPEQAQNIPEKQSPPANAEDNEKGRTVLESDHMDVRRTFSDPQQSPVNKTKRQKPLWKEVKDLKTGRSYYYHRVTRKTTWTRPKEMDEPMDEKRIERALSDEEPANHNAAGDIVTSMSDEELLSKTTDLKRGKGSWLRKSSARDFDPSVWRQKEEITKMYQTVRPTDGASIEGLLAQYEGREVDLLAHVQKMNESRPFDEPAASGDDVDEEEKQDAVSELQETTRTPGDSSRMSMPRSRSGATSKLSESTQPIANTKNKVPAYESIATSVSSIGGSLSRVVVAPVIQRVPSKIPAPRVRDRELVVEDLSQDHKKAQLLNNDSDAVVGNPMPTSVRERPFTTPKVADGPATITNDPVPVKEPAPIKEEENEDEEEYSSHAEDTISALSVNEMEFVNHESPSDLARRQALEDAICDEDWDKAAEISEEMKANRYKQNIVSPKQDRGEWKQSELDKFISDNDWEAVSRYIADLRAKQRDKREDSPSPETVNTGPEVANKGTWSNWQFTRSSREKSDANPVRSDKSRASDSSNHDDSDSSSDSGSEESEPSDTEHMKNTERSSKSPSRSGEISSSSESSSDQDNNDDYSEDYSSDSSSDAFQNRKSSRGFLSNRRKTSRH